MIRAFHSLRTTNNNSYGTKNLSSIWRDTLNSKEIGGDNISAVGLNLR